MQGEVQHPSSKEEVPFEFSEKTLVFEHLGRKVYIEGGVVSRRQLVRAGLGSPGKATGYDPKRKEGSH